MFDYIAGFYRVSIDFHGCILIKQQRLRQASFLGWNNVSS